MYVIVAQYLEEKALNFATDVIQLEKKDRIHRAKVFIRFVFSKLLRNVDPFGFILRAVWQPNQFVYLWKTSFLSSFVLISKLK